MEIREGGEWGSRAERVDQVIERGSEGGVKRVIEREGRRE